eukprot:scaffold27021_cov2942-Cylindrotheca_fusiformis.AAC.2
MAYAAALGSKSVLLTVPGVIGFMLVNYIVDELGEHVEEKIFGEAVPLDINKTGGTIPGDIGTKVENGGIVMAADVIASECVPPAVWVSGKCFVSLELYCWGACTANPYASAAGTQVLTSIVAD